jgi:hypothetical protein
MSHYADLHIIDVELTYRRPNGCTEVYETTIDAVVERRGASMVLKGAVEFRIQANGDELHVPSYMHATWFDYLMADKESARRLSDAIKTKWRRAS